jgi:formylglycine-generating enzyme required for sulfatase activity
VILLAAGKLVHVSGEVDRPLAMVAELCPGQAGDNEAAWLKAWLAGDVLLEIGTNRAADSELGKELLERVRKRMADLLNKGRLSVRERADAGDSLGRLGDPRLEEGNPKTGKTGPMVEIPGGRFWMGAQKGRAGERNFDQKADDDEAPVHEVELSPYRISKYPVTVGQYLRFMEDGGYKDNRCWESGGFGKFKEPDEWEDQKQYPSRPVVYVSWYEAAAFACWAGGRLPTEAEWERAARGPGQEYRKYPWGNKEPSPETANYGYDVIKRVTSVGIFPDDCSPEGVLDLAGNVWEWCRDWYSKEYYQLCARQGIVKDPCGPQDGSGRVVRGGSFFSVYHYYLRCAARYRYDTCLRDVNWGFRVVYGPSV